MKDNINRVAGKWLSEQKYQTGELDQEYKGYYDVDMPKILADFAQLHHREKMKEVIENMRVKKVDHYNAGGDFGINERDGYHLAICDLSDLTKPQER